MNIIKHHVRSDCSTRTTSPEYMLFIDTGDGLETYHDSYDSLQSALTVLDILEQDLECYQAVVREYYGSYIQRAWYYGTTL